MTDDGSSKRIMRHYEMLIFRHRMRKLATIWLSILVTSVIIILAVSGVFSSDIESAYAAELSGSPIICIEPVQVEAEVFYNEPANAELPEVTAVAQNLLATPEVVKSAYIVSLTDLEKFHVCQLAVVEAGGEGEDGCVAVMATVFNRYLSPNFPNTIDGVISERGQFAKCSQVTAEDIAEYPFMMSALERAMKGEDPAAEYLGERSLYFYSNVIELSANEKAMRDRISSKVLLGNQWFYGATGNMQGNREL